MKVNFDATINDLHNKPIVQDDKQLTLGSLVSMALLNSYEDERNLGGDEKVRRFKLAQKAIAGGEQDLRAEEITSIKALVAKAYSPLPVGRCYELLDPVDGEKQEEEPVKTRMRALK